MSSFTPRPPSGGGGRGDMMMSPRKAQDATSPNDPASLFPPPMTLTKQTWDEGEEQDYTNCGAAMESLLKEEQELRYLYATPCANRTPLERMFNEAEGHRNGAIASTNYDMLRLYGFIDLNDSCAMRTPLEVHEAQSRVEYRRTTFDDLKDCLRDLLYHSNVDAFHSCKPHVQKMNKAICGLEGMLENSRVELGPGVASSANPLLKLTHSMLGLETIDEPIQLIRQAAEDIQISINEIQKAEDEAEDDENYDQLAECIQQRIELLYSLLDQLDRQIVTLDERVDDFAEYTDQQAEDLATEGNQACSDYRASINLMKGDSEADYQQLSNFRKRMEKENSERNLEWSSIQTQYERTIENNSREQSNCWATIDELERKLGSLASERNMHVRAYAAAVKSNHERQSIHEQCMRSIDNHQALLRSTIDTCDTSLDATQTIQQDVLAAALEQHYTRRNEALRQLEHLRKPFHREVYTEFHKLCAALQSLGRIKAKSLDIQEQKAAGGWQLGWLTEKKRKELTLVLRKIITDMNELMVRYDPTVQFLSERQVKAFTATQRLEEDTDIAGYLAQIDKTMQKHRDERIVVPPVDPPMGRHTSIPTMPKIRQQMIAPETKVKQRKDAKRNPSAALTPAAAVGQKHTGVLYHPVNGQMPYIQPDRLRCPARDEPATTDNETAADEAVLMKLTASEIGSHGSPRKRGAGGQSPRNPY